MRSPGVGLDTRSRRLTNQTPKPPYALWMVFLAATGSAFPWSVRPLQEQRGARLGKGKAPERVLAKSPHVADVTSPSLRQRRASTCHLCRIRAQAAVIPVSPSEQDAFFVSFLLRIPFLRSISGASVEPSRFFLRG